MLYSVSRGAWYITSTVVLLSVSINLSISVLMTLTTLDESQGSQEEPPSPGGDVLGDMLPAMAPPVAASKQRRGKCASVLEAL